MNKTRIAASLALAAGAAFLFARTYSCGISGDVFDITRLTCRAEHEAYWFWSDIARNVILTAPVWVCLAVAIWFVLPTVARFADRALYAVGIDTRRIAERWRARK